MGALDELTDEAASAIKLASCGLPVFPCDRDKKPLCAHGFKDASTDADQVRVWWEQYPYALPGVPTGKTTEIFVLDVDVKGGKDGHATLAQLGYEIPPTRSHKTQTGGGRHYLFHMPGDTEIRSSAGKIGPGVDTRADGGYIVWWPAIGLPVDNAQILLPIPQWLLDATAPPPPVPDVSVCDLQKRDRRETEDFIGNLLSSSVGMQTFFPDLIPTEEGQRHRKLFELARWLKSINPDMSREEQRQYVQEWHRHALPFIGTKDFAASWAEFLNGWPKVNYPLGKTLELRMEGIDFEAPLPDSILMLGYGKAANRLIRICKALQRHEGEKPFFISARKAGELIQTDPTDTSRIMKALVADGVLELVSKGAGKVASRYRYIWPE